MKMEIIICISDNVSALKTYQKLR